MRQKISAFMLKLSNKRESSLRLCPSCARVSPDPIFPRLLPGNRGGHTEAVHNEGSTPTIRPPQNLAPLPEPPIIRTV